MKVKCINDDWSNVRDGSIASLVLKVGDPMPEKEKIYEVIGHSFDETGVKGYELAEFDYSNYPGGLLLFNKNRFVVVDNSFVPNHVIQEGYFKGTPVRKENMYCSFSFKANIGKMPRKKKKKFKKYGITYIKK